jgi:hypothetical protein
MLKQWLDYYLFSIKIEGFSIIGGPIGIPSKLEGVFVKGQRGDQNKIYVCGLDYILILIEFERGFVKLAALLAFLQSLRCLP